MNMDFNSADRQFDIIPDNTIVPLIMHIKPGGQGDGGWLRPSKNSDALMLECELTVLEGPFAKRKVYQYMVVSGGKQNEKSESIAGSITRSNLRAILESARSINPDDMSPEATQKRCCVNGYADFNGICFMAKIGIEKGQNGYNDNNKIKVVITPDMEGYVSLPQQAAQAAATPPPSWGAPQQSQGQMPPPATNSNPVPSWAR